MLWPVTKALIGHYRRYPFQLALVILGLTLGVSLLVGVQTVNRHAEKSYHHGEKLFSDPLPYRIRSKRVLQRIPNQVFAQITRNEEFGQCLPFESVKVTSLIGTDIALSGVDIQGMRSLAFMLDEKNRQLISLLDQPERVILSQALAEQLHVKDGGFVTLKDGINIGPVQIDTKGLLDGLRGITDITQLHKISKSAGISEIACTDMGYVASRKLKRLLPESLLLTRSSRPELSTLSNAFNNNLFSMGLLAFIVGLFIYYQAMSLIMLQRQNLVGTLRQMGVSSIQLTKAILGEIFLLVIVSWALGNILGLVLAHYLIPNVSLAVGELYNINVSLDVEWDWLTSLASFILVLSGALVSCFWPLFRLLRSQPNRLTPKLSLVRFAGTEFALQAYIACFLGLVAVGLHQLPQNLNTGYGIIVLTLLSVTLFTPFLIWRFFTSFSASVHWLKVRWFFSDAAANMSFRGVATMGFMLAMTANISIETMIGSFKETTNRWVNQHFAADLYIYPTYDISRDMTLWLNNNANVEKLWLRWEREVLTNNGPIQLVSIGDSEDEMQSISIKVGAPNYWYHLHHGKAIMISESMSEKLSLKVGDFIDFPNPLGNKWQVAGIYYDYGNPYNQVLLSHRNWLYAFAGLGTVAYGVVLHDDTKHLEFKHSLEKEFNLNSERVFDHNHVNSLTMRVFNRTFDIANTLGKITLFIAVLGIFFSTIAGELTKQKHVALLRCLGVSRRSLLFTGCLQLALSALISIMIALPLGLMLAELLVEVIILPAFGWRLQLTFMLEEYISAILWAMFAVVLAGAIPLLKAVRKLPMESFRRAL
ncbi:ABC transporter permease [Vibrio sp.]|nr:ABC transporter permease [Vibrio sp.]